MKKYAVALKYFSGKYRFGSSAVYGFYDNKGNIYVRPKYRYHDYDDTVEFYLAKIVNQCRYYPVKISIEKIKRNQIRYYSKSRMILVLKKKGV